MHYLCFWFSFTCCIVSRFSFLSYLQEIKFRKKNVRKMKTSSDLHPCSSFLICKRPHRTFIEYFLKFCLFKFTRKKSKGLPFVVLFNRSYLTLKGFLEKNYSEKSLFLKLVTCEWVNFQNSYRFSLQLSEKVSLTMISTEHFGVPAIVTTFSGYFLCFEWFFHTFPNAPWEFCLYFDLE